MTDAKQTTDKLDGLVDKLREGSLHQRAPRIVTALGALVGDHRFLLCVMPPDGGEALILGNESIDAGVDMLEQALQTARKYVGQDDGAAVAH